jgi:hypothetical protein
MYPQPQQQQQQYAYSQVPSQTRWMAELPALQPTSTMRLPMWQNY